jgi:hypothetical protein
VGNLPGLSGGGRAALTFLSPVFLSVSVAPEITRFHLNYNRERHSDAQAGVDLINSVYGNVERGRALRKEEVAQESRRLVTWDLARHSGDCVLVKQRK